MKRKFLIFVMFICAQAHGQIPVIKIESDFIKTDPKFDAIAIKGDMKLWPNRWHSIIDFNDDGKQDIVLQMYSSPNDAYVSVIYNQSTKDTVLLKGDFKSNFYVGGYPGNFGQSIGNLNGDQHKEVFILTQNYHGPQGQQPKELYPDGSENTPDKLFINKIDSFKRVVSNRNFNSESSKIMELGKDGKKSIVVSNYLLPQEGNSSDSINLLYKYDLTIPNIDTLSESYIFKAPRKFQLLCRAVSIIEENKNFNYFEIEKFGNNGLDTIFILKFAKGSYLSLGAPHDTVAIIPIKTIQFSNVKYRYVPNIDLGIFVLDIDKDGKEEVITQENIVLENISENQLPNGFPDFVRINVYDRNGNTSNIFIDSLDQYSRQRGSGSNGINLVDINNDSYLDIVPHGGFGWDPINVGGKLLPDTSTKMIVYLNTGKKMTPFALNFKDTVSMNKLAGGYIIPMDVDNDKDIEIISLKANIPLHGPAAYIKMDFSNFKFPCSLNQPKYNLTGKLNFCNNDSSILKIDSVTGYKTRWYLNDQLISSTNNIVIKESNNIKVTITNLGGCTSEKLIQVTKHPVPSPPTIARDADNNLLASTNGITWYKDGVKISDTTQKFKPTTNGLYTATTTQNGCTSSISQSYYYLTSALTNLSNGEYLKISPNPTSGDFRIDYHLNTTTDLLISINDINGRGIITNQKLRPGNKVNLRGVIPGSYIVLVKDKTGRLITTQKIVKD